MVSASSPESSSTKRRSPRSIAPTQSSIGDSNRTPVTPRTPRKAAHTSGKKYDKMAVEETLEKKSGRQRLDSSSADGEEFDDAPALRAQPTRITRSSRPGATKVRANILMDRKAAKASKRIERDASSEEEREGEPNVHHDGDSDTSSHPEYIKIRPAKRKKLDSVRNSGSEGESDVRTPPTTRRRPTTANWRHGKAGSAENPRIC
ncbi:hypothetical protein HDU93_005382, partial [Gonapodya sp. JEL0774]